MTNGSNVTQTQCTENLFNEKKKLLRSLFLQPTRQRVYLSVSPSVRQISFNYSAENLLIPTIKATIEHIGLQGSYR